jgi:hypothetical protein
VSGTEMLVWPARQRLVFAMTGRRDVSAFCHNGRSLCSMAGNLVQSRALATLIVVKSCHEGLCGILQVADNWLI